ncbi:MAG: hypothetical protein PF542_00660 [Nanoarchaeota archaeon]|jgi:O-acetyl-ADP-ribose deacetylase (regulator of RNase III)|nr:hypothetical protein [Nanoarchaeota archaeon]
MKTKINNIKIELKKDCAIKQDVDLSINSANGLLLMRTITAKAIREYSDKLNPVEKNNYSDILYSFKNPVMQKYIETFRIKEWEPRQAQMSSFRRILENNRPYKTGQCIIDKEWSKTESKHVLHVIGMTYHLKDDRELDVDKISEESLTKTLTNAFRYIDQNRYETISTPILCTRGDYGLNPKTTLRSILNAIKIANPIHLKKVIICFESEGPMETFDQLTEKELKGIIK